MNDTKRTTMETYSGGWFDFNNMDPDAIEVRDIAQALSLTCRFGGQIPFFYSVAQHALLVSKLVDEHFERPDLAYPALHHDSHEAYVGDVPTPLKNTFGEEYTALVKRIDNCIGYKLGINPAQFDQVFIHAADELALFIEASVLKVSRGVGVAWGRLAEPPEALTYSPWVTEIAPDEAADAFIARHDSLRPVGGPYVMHHSV